MIMHYSKGGLSNKELEEMSFDKMGMYLKEAQRIQGTNPENIEDTGDNKRHG